jgi:hypothetical protein
MPEVVQLTHMSTAAVSHAQLTDGPLRYWCAGRGGSLVVKRFGRILFWIATVALWVSLI